MSRPRKHVNASARRAASEARRLAGGGRNVRVVLNASAAAALRRLTDSGMTATAAIEQALLATAPLTRAHTDDGTP